MKKLALAVAAVFAVCSLSAALPQLEKVWKIDFRQKITEAEMIAISKDGKLPGTKTFQLDENGSYTANFNSALSAVLVNTVTAPADGNYLLGFCADWQATIFVNGEKVAVGSSRSVVTKYSRGFTIKLKKGKNILAIYMPPGFDFWSISTGFLPMVEDFPKDTDLQKQILNFSFTEPPFITHPPYVTRVSPTQATVGVILSRPGIVGLKLSDGRVFWQSEHGLLSLKKNFLFTIDGLTPGKTYTYEIFLQPARRKPQTTKLFTGKFTTFSDKAAPHSFFIFSDLQIANPLKLQFLSDFADNCKVKENTFIVPLGDISDNTDAFEFSYFTYFHNKLVEKGVNLPMQVVRGNHECWGNQNYYYYKYFGTPYYAFRCGEVFYIVLDNLEGAAVNPKRIRNQLHSAMFKYMTEQAKWLDEVVKSPECVNAKYRVVFSHYPPYNMQQIEFLAGRHFLGKNPAVPVHLWFAAHTHSPYRGDPATGKLIGATFPKPLTPRQIKSQQRVKAAVSALPFPVYVNDGPGSSGTILSGIKVNFNGKFFEIKCLDWKGKVLDHILYTPGKPFEVKSTTWVELGT